jgi:hypothetical protein
LGEGVDPNPRLQYVELIRLVIQLLDK